MVSNIPRTAENESMKDRLNNVYGLYTRIISPAIASRLILFSSFPKYSEMRKMVIMIKALMAETVKPVRAV